MEYKELKVLVCIGQVETFGSVFGEELGLGLVALADGEFGSSFVESLQ